MDNEKLELLALVIIERGMGRIETLCELLGLSERVMFEKMLAVILARPKEEGLPCSPAVTVRVCGRDLTEEECSKVRALCRVYVHEQVRKAKTYESRARS